MTTELDPFQSKLATERVRPNTPDERYLATRRVFRSDRRAGRRVSDTAQLLEMLGLDLDDALNHERALPSA